MNKHSDVTNIALSFVAAVFIYLVGWVMLETDISFTLFPLGVIGAGFILGYVLKTWWIDGMLILLSVAIEAYLFWWLSNDPAPQQDGVAAWVGVVAIGAVAVFTLIAVLGVTIGVALGRRGEP